MISPHCPSVTYQNSTLSRPVPILHFSAHNNHTLTVHSGAGIYFRMVEEPRNVFSTLSKVKCTLVQALRLSTGRTAHRGSRGIAVLFLVHCTRRVWGVSVTARPLYPRERPGTHCTGGWMGHRAGLDRWGKSRPQTGFDLRTVHPVAIRYTDCATRPTFSALHGIKFQWALPRAVFVCTIGGLCTAPTTHVHCMVHLLIM